jgi:hypothetical protein
METLTEHRTGPVAKYVRREGADEMAGLLIAGVALVAAAAVIHSLHAAWKQCSAQALDSVLHTDRRVTRDVEVALAADVIAGRISGDQYRQAAAALAAKEPQPLALQRLVG